MAMDPNTHSLCDDCFRAGTPATRAHTLDPAPSPQSDPYVCCRCGVTHTSGIYVKRDPELLLCKGVHA